ncbi:hypothetical protein [Paraclostridium bifermentans]|uniref:hypothetical protein n=1 Tax=Paraclostridium bifermentans TaxID=1490 RepID=UPI00359C5A96
MIRIFYMTIAYLITYLVLENLNKKYLIIDKIDSKLKSRFEIANKNGFYIMSTVFATIVIYIIVSSFMDVPEEAISIFQGVTLPIAIIFDSRKKE